ncbi:TonB-dependent receptor [Maricurvus nonylphenolicus]|uniref:TonB-dependent receptor n=1 Tax=Maricurvus nonylphenolicus TaxID=1008307 RepID=UPI0036F1B32C
MLKKSLPVAISVATLLPSLPVIANDASFTLEEIVVTAQKREQSLQDVPVAVTAYDSQAMKAQGIDDAVDLNTASPSVNFNTAQNKVSNSPVRIRGIGTNGTNAAFEGAVGLYMDGVYRSRSGMVLATFNDISSVEILRGPQGTLFGKNTSAGAMILSSTKPSQDFEAGGEVTLGNYDKQKASFYVNGAVTDTLAMRASIISDKRDGFIDNPVTGKDQLNTDIYSAKVQALWQPSDELEVRVIADYSKSDETCCYGMETRVDAPDPSNPFDAFYTALSNARGLPYYTADQFDRDNYNNQDGSDESTDKGISVDVTYDINERLTLKSITSYREYSNDQTQGDADFGPVDLLKDYQQLYDFETLSQEFNLTGDFELGDTPVEYVVGAFYSKEDLDHIYKLSSGADMGANFDLIFNDGSGSPVDGLFTPAELANPDAGPFVASNFEHEDEVWAAYGHFTFSLTEQVNLVTGLRYSEEEKTLKHTNLMGDANTYFDNLRQNNAGWLLLGASTGSPDFENTISDEEWTYTASVQYFPMEDLQLYATYSKGFKAGGISLNPDAAGQLIDATTYLTWLALPAVPLQLSGKVDSSYDPEYVDAYEVGLKTGFHDGRGRLNMALFYSDYEDIQVTTFVGTSFVTDNADTAKSQGIELELDYAVTENLRADLSVTYLDDTSYGSSELIPHLEGRDQAFAPEFAGALNISYSNEISSTLEGYMNLNVSYMGEHYISNDIEETEEYTLVGSTFGVRTLDGVWDLSLFCRNCFDTEFYTNGNTAPLQWHAPEMANQGPPRTYGVTVSANF